MVFLFQVESTYTTVIQVCHERQVADSGIRYIMDKPIEVPVLLKTLDNILQHP